MLIIQTNSPKAWRVLRSYTPMEVSEAIFGRTAPIDRGMAMYGLTRTLPDRMTPEEIADYARWSGFQVMDTDDPDIVTVPLPKKFSRNRFSRWCNLNGLGFAARPMYCGQFLYGDAFDIASLVDYVNSKRLLK